MTKSSGLVTSYIELHKSKGSAKIIDKGNGLTEKMGYLQKKNTVSLLYEAQLYNTLSFSIDKIIKTNLQDATKYFLGHFFSLAFYRIPDFQQEVVKVLDEGFRRRMQSVDASKYAHLNGIIA